MTKERVVELRKLQALGVTNDPNTTIMQECYFHDDGEVDIDVLLDAAESEIRLRESIAITDRNFRALQDERDALTVRLQAMIDVIDDIKEAVGCWSPESKWIDSLLARVK